MDGYFSFGQKTGAADPTAADSQCSIPSANVGVPAALAGAGYTKGILYQHAPTVASIPAWACLPQFFSPRDGYVAVASVSSRCMGKPVAGYVVVALLAPPSPGGTP